MLSRAALKNSCITILRRFSYGAPRGAPHVGDSRRSALTSVPRTFAVLRHDAGSMRTSSADRLVLSLLAFAKPSSSMRSSAGPASAAGSAISKRARVRRLCRPTAMRMAGLCVRQADCLLLLANARDKPAAWPESACADASAHSRARATYPDALRRLVRGRRAALARTHADLPYHHVRDAHDVRRVARLLPGRSLGLVLSGGGARGFAQIGGCVRCANAGLEIDSVGGTASARSRRRHRARMVRRGMLDHIPAQLRRRPSAQRLHAAARCADTRARVARLLPTSSNRATSPTSCCLISAARRT